VQDLYKKIIDKIAQSKANCNSQADIRKKFKTFNVGDYVMIQIHLERFSLEPQRNYMLVVLVHSKS